MPPKKPAPKKAPKTAPQNYHCIVCGTEHDKDAEGAKPVSWDKGAGLHGTYYVGRGALRNPKLPPGFRPSLASVTDGLGSKTAKTSGLPYVGWCCLGKFQATAASSYYQEGRNEYAPTSVWESACQRSEILGPGIRSCARLFLQARKHAGLQHANIVLVFLLYLLVH